MADLFSPCRSTSRRDDGSSTKPRVPRSPIHRMVVLGEARQPTRPAVAAVRAAGRQASEVEVTSHSGNRAGHRRSDHPRRQCPSSSSSAARWPTKSAPSSGSETPRCRSGTPSSDPCCSSRCRCCWPFCSGPAPPPTGPTSRWCGGRRVRHGCCKYCGRTADDRSPRNSQAPSKGGLTWWQVQDSNLCRR